MLVTLKLDLASSFVQPPFSQELNVVEPAPTPKEKEEGMKREAGSPPQEGMFQNGQRWPKSVGLASCKWWWCSNFDQLFLLERQVTAGTIVSFVDRAAWQWWSFR